MKLVETSRADRSASAKIKVTLVKSTFGRLERHRACVRGLGLGKMHSSHTLIATPEVMGMVNKIAYMLKVEELS
ncbi:MAG: 50S ribosomal protein L30 [Panacagrimonas sp.]